MIDVLWFEVTAKESINESNAWIIGAKRKQWSPYKWCHIVA
jgi:hypothetical protein